MASYQDYKVSLFLAFFSHNNKITYSSDMFTHTSDKDITCQLLLNYKR